MFWSLLTTVAVIAACSGGLVKLYQWVVSRKIYNLRGEDGSIVKGSAPTFLFGDLLRQIFFPSSLEDKSFLQQGDVYLRWFFWRPVVYIVDHAAIKRVLMENSSNYVRATTMSKNNLLAADDFEFKRHRRVMERVFEPENLFELSDTLVNSSRSFLSDLLLDNQGNGKLFDVHKMAVKYTRELMGHLMYGTGTNAKNVIEAHKVLTDNSKSFLRFVLPWLGRVAPKLFGLTQLQHGTNALNELAGKPEEGTILALLVKAAAQDEEGMYIREIKSNMIALGYAGIEATASALASLMFVLITHPEQQDKIHHEIQQVIGEGPITYDSLKKLPHLTKVIKETMRMYPPYPVLFPRIAKRADKLAGFHIPPKTSVVIDVVGHNRHPQYWAHPDEFNPERFCKDDEVTPVKNLSITWGMGPRNSVGKRLAMMILRTTVVNLLRKYRICTSNAKIAGVEIVRSFGTLKPQPTLVAKVSSWDAEAVNELEVAHKQQQEQAQQQEQQYDDVNNFALAQDAM